MTGYNQPCVLVKFSKPCLAATSLISGSPLTSPMCLTSWT